MTVSSMPSDVAASDWKMTSGRTVVAAVVIDELVVAVDGAGVAVVVVDGVVVVVEGAGVVVVVVDGDGVVVVEGAGVVVVVVDGGLDAGVSGVT